MQQHLLEKYQFNFVNLKLKKISTYAVNIRLSYTSVMEYKIELSALFPVFIERVSYAEIWWASKNCTQKGTPAIRRSQTTLAEIFTINLRSNDFKRLNCL